MICTGFPIFRRYDKEQRLPEDRRIPARGGEPMKISCFFPWKSGGHILYQKIFIVIYFSIQV
jgi:hypothetical protein